ncbi:DNA-processing protein DprA [Flavobacteriaceae bacterium]|nr:DNA-processing protein DprA [Flavobacteriaceae bacterium]MDB9955846.1 DNA-processing protein DprA [Flavobacteriaceae bacterium]
MKEEETLALLRLQKTPSIGDILAKKLIATVGSAADIFKEKNYILQKINGIGSYAIQNLLDDSNQQLAEKEFQYIKKHKIEYSYFLDKDYPLNLQHCIDAPILFFKDGTIDFSNEKIISIVGTRTMTNYGSSFCEKLIDELAVYNPIIVSGFAYGVDICAHKAAMKNNLQTIAVLAHGLEQIYPKVHKKYIHKVNQHGGFITEFFHNEAPQRENFLRRNRIVAGISKATIVVESASKGGSLVTADIANSYDRDVFAVPGRINDRMSEGCNDLIYRNKAHLLQSSEDIVKMLNWDISKTTTPEQTRLFVELTDVEQKIVDFLQQKEQELLDVIALETHIPVYQLATILLQLELKNVVKPLPGKMFKLS